MADRASVEQLLDHSVSATLHNNERGLTVAASVAGEPPNTRVAWIDWRASDIVARLACPPGRPSRLRPLVATELRLAQAGIEDRILAIRAVPDAAAVRLVVADEVQPDAIAIEGDGVALVRAPENLLIVAIEALSREDEPIGRLDAAGVGSLRLADGRITGRLGVTHGLAAGFGGGWWVDDRESVELESGFVPAIPAWIPADLDRGAFHLEPDIAYPAAPPSVVVAWGTEPRRVLVRQTPGILASPDPGGGRSRAARVGEWPARIMSRGRFATLIWETDDRAFGVQVQGFDDPEAVALRVAGSV